MSITLDGSLGITAPTYGGIVAAEYSVPVTSMKNRIINGTGRIFQRNSAATTNLAYGVDRWQLQFNGTGISVASAQATSASDPTGYHFYIQSQTAKTTLASGDFIFVCQSIEGFNVADLQWGTASAKTITVSFVGYASVAGNYSVFIRNAASNRSYCSLVAMTVGYATYSITIPGDTTGTWANDNTTGLQLGFTLTSGSALTTTGNAWTAGNFIAATGQSNGANTLNQFINLTNVQLEVGSTATSFDYRPYGTELTLCQRYYQIGNQSGGAGGDNIIFSGNITATGTYYAQLRFPVVLRASPTMAYNTTAVQNFPSSPPTEVSKTIQGVAIGLVASGTGSGSYWYTWSASAEL